MASRKLKIVFHMIDAVGPQNACIGLGQALLARGHQVYFLTKTNNRAQGKFSQYGFITHALKATDDETNGDMTEEQALAEQKKEIEMFISFGIFENISPEEKLKLLFNEDFMEEYMKTFYRYEEQIRAFLEREKPDLIVVDAIGITPPALLHSGIPWVQLYCSNPLGLFHSEQLPPATFGLPIADRSQWDKYRQVYHEVHDGYLAKNQRRLLEHVNYPVPEDHSGVILSPYLNIYQFPAELDYDDAWTRPETFFRVDAMSREEPGEYQLPEKLKNQMKSGDKLIFFSLGSIGTSNVPLMRRIISILAKTPHYYIVSKGLFHEEIELADNMVGERYLPQTKILPIVDLAIIHGGNNSLTEAFYAGTPIIVIPLFYDQFDNAQRVYEKQFGVRIDPHEFKDEDLVKAIDRMLGDQELKNKFVAASKRIRESQTKEKACLEMEKVVEKFGKKRF